MKKLIILVAIWLPQLSFAQINVEQIEDINGYPAFIITYDNHIVDLNKTRALAGANPLIETEEMVVKAKNRCIWAANNLEDYGHQGAELPENAGRNGGVHIRLNELLEQEDKSTFIKNTTLNQYNGILKNYITVRKGNGYNNSLLHYKNRVNQKWSEFGNAFILFFKPNRIIEGSEGNKRKVTGYVVWHYELFR